jgi:MFS superfamily sulfate permease-like transporter
VGNILSGLLGGLPMTGVVARSTVNVQAGARTRLSAMLHGVWILAAVVALPMVLQLIPVCSLAALLVYTGLKLIDIQVVKKLMKFGQGQAVIYAVTLGMIVATDLLTGVLVGFALSLGKLVLTMTELSVGQSEESGRLKLTVKGTATFVALPKLAEALDDLPAGKEVLLDSDELVYIDHACLELLHSWETRYVAAGGRVTVDWPQLDARSDRPGNKE